MNRRTGTGHLTEDPKLLETDTGTAICTLRIIAASGSGHRHTHYARCSPSSVEFAPSPAGRIAEGSSGAPGAANSSAVVPVMIRSADWSPLAVWRSNHRVG